DLVLEGFLDGVLVGDFVGDSVGVSVGGGGGFVGVGDGDGRTNDTVAGTTTSSRTAAATVTVTSTFSVFSGASSFQRKTASSPPERSPAAHSSEVKGAVHAPVRVTPLALALMPLILTSATAPPVASMVVVTSTVSPASGFAGLVKTSTSRPPGAGDAGSDADGDGEGAARADGPPAARTAAAPRPTKIGFTADRQVTAAAPPSHRRLSVPHMPEGSPRHSCEHGSAGRINPAPPSDQRLPDVLHLRPGSPRLPDSLVDAVEAEGLGDGGPPAGVLHPQPALVLAHDDE